MISNAGASGRDQSALRFSWERRDHHRLVTVVALIGFVAAAALGVWGLPPVDLHGPLHKVGIMDPLCGGTRAARYTIEGRLGEAWRYNPLGILSVLGAFVVTVRTLVGLSGRRWLNVTIAWTSHRRAYTTVIVVALLVMLEVRQQGRADLLMQGTFTF